MNFVYLLLVVDHPAPFRVWLCYLVGGVNDVLRLGSFISGPPGCTANEMGALVPNKLHRLVRVIRKVNDFFWNNMAIVTTTLSSSTVRDSVSLVLGIRRKGILDESLREVLCGRRSESSKPDLY